MLSTGAWDGVDAGVLARLLDLPAVHALEETTSALDEAHRLAAAGAASGTLVLAERQTAGRGRDGRRWASHARSGIWLALVERPAPGTLAHLLSLRVGLRLAPVLERWTVAHIQLKWPNDLYVGAGKLAGILAEARWRDARVEWVAIGVGVNAVLPPEYPGAASLTPGARRAEVLAEMVPAIRAAAAARGELARRELEAYARRDAAAGRRCSAPAPGVVRGINAAGELVIQGYDGETLHRAGSLVLEGS